MMADSQVRGAEESIRFLGPRGWTLHARHWPLLGARGTLVGVHGYSEHSGSYRHFADFLSERGLEVFWIDLPGHGLSDGRRSDIQDFNDYVRSLEAALSEIQRRACSRPLYLFGHSLGGLVSIRFLQSSPKASMISRVLLSSPLLGLHKFSPRTLSFLKVATWILPNISLPNEEELGGGSLTHDEGMIAKRRADPLIKSRVTIHWVREFLKARTLAFEEVQKIKIPLALFQAGDDRVVDRKEAERFYSQIESPKEIKIYEGMFHELVNEVNRQVVMEDMSKWLMIK